MYYVFPLVLSALSLVRAEANFADWHPPQDGQVRSPCPALNALANHGILPRDGYNLTTPIIVKALGEGLNVSAETATLLASTGLSVSKDPASGAFNLDDLDKHNAVEHDGSLSRKDYDLGDTAQDFDPSVFAETLSYFGGKSEVGLADVAAARWGRIQCSNATNPKFTYGDPQYFPSYFESSAYFQLFKDTKTNKASVKWIDIFFREERMPFNEGWRPVNPINGVSIAQTVLQLALHTPEKLPEGSL
ncbi:Chloroperoxidase [Paraphoma chrysanthemicola]|uniref:Chloroperoxidase n=1 Tax=Paraphoma chrysanthemicola TaxID=798071 RepID=A0A8K0VTE1_9PLEO|nr:Chloroperoxidase [Paraphoma chrysanthemicola]